MATSWRFTGTMRTPRGRGGCRVDGFETFVVGVVQKRNNTIQGGCSLIRSEMRDVLRVWGVTRMWGPYIEGDLCNWKIDICLNQNQSISIIRKSN